MGDILVRRVLIDFEWLAALVGWLPRLGRQSDEAPAGQPIERLKQSKAQISADLERRSARVGLPPAANQPVATSPPPPIAATPPAEDDSYTARLLAAKRRARGADRRD